MFVRALPRVEDLHVEIPDQAQQVGIAGRPAEDEPDMRRVSRKLAKDWIHRDPIANPRFRPCVLVERPVDQDQTARRAGGNAERPGHRHEQGHVIAGSPETVRQRMEDLIKGLNVGNIFCLMHVGNMPADKCMYSTKLFAEKVMPKLRNMFPDWADDNRFWTSPLDKRVTAGRLPKEAPTSADLAKTYA